MLSRLPAPLRGVITSTLLGLNTLIGVAAMIVPALVKLLVPVTAVRNACTRLLNTIANRWIANNNAWIGAVNPARWDVQGVKGLHRRGWYLVSSNHQSWVDILVLQRVLHGHVPFLKFFLKAELIWVPVIGLAWWALDFPFMKRGKGRGARHNDLRTTRRTWHDKRDWAAMWRPMGGPQYQVPEPPRCIRSVPSDQSPRRAKSEHYLRTL